MTAINHAITGALVGLAVHNPWLALPLAFVSHFALDAVPHYDPPETDRVKLYKSTAFLRDFIVLGALSCFALVLFLAVARPSNWFVAIVCAFLAASPDLFWLPLYIRVRRYSDGTQPTGWFFWLHGKVQWKTGPIFKWLELSWFMASVLALWQFL